MSAAKAYADARATADLRMGVLAMDTDGDIAPRFADDDEFNAEDRWVGKRSPAATGPSEVWCAHCPERATVEVRLTTGETRAYCGRHLTRLTIQTPLGQIEKTWEELQ